MIYFELMKGSDLWILAGIILGGLIVTGYTAAQYIKGVNSEIETAEAQNDRDSIEKDFRIQLAAKNDEISGLQNQANDKLTEANSKLIDVNKKSEELVAAYEKLNAENIKIQGIQNETIKMTIGEGIPNVEINNFANNIYTVGIRNRGNYPMYDVSLSMYDFDLIKKTCPLIMDKGILIVDEDCLDLNTIYFSPDNTIRSKGRVRLSQTITLKEGYNNIVFNSHARHNSFIFRYVIKNDNQKLSFVYKVYDVNSSGRPEVFTDGKLKISEDYWDKNFPPLNLKYGRVLRRDEKN
jgi:hypothetical protein